MNGIIIKIIIIKGINKLKKNKALKPNKIFYRFLLIITILFIKILFIYFKYI